MSDYALPVSVSITQEQLAWLDARRRHGSLSRSAALRQVLNARTFAEIRPGMAMEDVRKLLGKPMSVGVQLADGGERHFHGIVTQCSQSIDQGQFASYQVTLRPWLWLLSRTSDCRIFQNLSIPQIIKQVFRDLGFSDFEDALSRPYREWEYCVQYRETSFDFVSRLMEQEGIYYFFRHEQDRHVLVLADAYGAHATVPGYVSIPYYPKDEQQRGVASDG